MELYLILVYLFSAFLNILFGVLAFLFDRKSKSNISFFVFSLITGIWILSLFFLYYSGNPYNELVSSIAVKAAYAFSLIMATNFVVFLYFFPRKTFHFSNLIKFLFLGINAIFVLITSFTNLIYEKQILVDGIYKYDKLGDFYFLYVFFIITNFLIALYLGVSKLFKLTGIDKNKLQIVVYAFCGYGVIAILINVILPIFNIYSLQQIMVVFSILFLGPTFYSIQKHRFFNISYLALELLRKLILLTIFIVSTVLLNHLLVTILPSINYVVIFIISILAGLYLWIQLMKYFPKLTAVDFINFKKNINKLKISIPLCSKYNELEQILEKHFVINQNITSTNLFVIRKSDINENIPIYIKDKFTNLLEENLNEIYIKQEIEYLKLNKKNKKLLKENLDYFDASICIPLHAEHKLIGFFLLGNKEKNKLYTKEEINQILSIKPQLEIALTNFLLKLNLQEENNMMKEIIEKKTKKLQQQFKEIKNLLEQQSDFIAVTAHEFRTPLSIAMFQLEDTLTTHEHTPQVVKDMEVMSESLNNLRHLTQTLFDVQQYDLNKIKLNKSKLDLNEYLNHIVKEFKLIMEEKNIDLQFKNNIEKQINIEIDKQQIRQVFANLLNNAIKFANKDNPEISIEVNENKNSVEIAIIDNGTGVQDKDKERVFEKFQTTKVSMGTGIGLGLYICKKIIELHKGKIWIEDNKPKGTKFIFELRK